MKLIFKFARTELRNLFYSPVAWFLSIAFLVQCAVFYTSIIEQLAVWQEMLVNNAPGWESFGRSVTEMVFLNPDGIFSAASRNLYLFIPLLTMGLINREINSGTIKLLYSSPIKTRDIVFGKFLAIMIYNLLLMGIMAIFMIAGLQNIQHVDTGVVLSAALGFYLLVCAFTAIGIFMSSLSTYQIVSAIATFIIIFVLSRIGGLWQKVDFVRDLTYFLSMNGRIVKMISGLITTNDVIYFLLVIYMFLSFTLFKLRGTRESKPWYKKGIRYVLVVVSVLAIGYVSNLPGMIGYWDTTRNNINTIHPNTQEVVKGFEKDEPLEVTLYGNMLGDGFSRGGSPETRNNYKWELWEKYLRFKPDIKFKYEYYYDILDGDSSMFELFKGKSLPQIAASMAEALGVDTADFKSPEVMRKEIDLEPEGGRLVMQLKYKGRTTFLRTFKDAKFWPQEMEVSAAFKRLQQADMPKLLYTSANLERNINKTGEREYIIHAKYKLERISLINLGFDADSIDLNTQDIPAGIAALIVADPKTELNPVVQEKIRKYIAEGNNVMFLTEPGKQQMLNPLLADLGVELKPGTLVELSKNEMPQFVRPGISDAMAYLSEFSPYCRILRDAMSRPGYEERRNTSFQPGVVEVEQIADKGFTFIPLLETRPDKVFNKLGTLVTDSVPPVFTPAEGDIKKKSFVTLAGLTRKVNNKEQRIVVSGDADWLSTIRYGNNADMGLALFGWFDNNRFPIYAPVEPAMDNRLTISATTAKMQTTFFVWILPALILLLGSVILIRRKRK